MIIARLTKTSLSVISTSLVLCGVERISNHDAVRPLRINRAVSRLPFTLVRRRAGVFTIDIDRFMVEIDEGAFKNVGPATKAATAKLFGVEQAEAREFGDKRVKLAFEDGEGNEVEVALFPEEARQVREDLADLEAESPVFDDE